MDGINQIIKHNTYRLMKCLLCNYAYNSIDYYCSTSTSHREITNNKNNVKYYLEQYIFFNRFND